MRTSGDAVPTRPRSASVAASARGSYVKLPMRFEPNTGRTDRSVDFIARGAGYAVYLSGTRTILALAPVDASRAHGVVPEPPQQLTIALAGARSSVRPVPAGRLAGLTNQFRGNDRRKWLTGIPAYERVEYRGVYPGVDVVYYGNQRQLEYDFVVAPGASYRTIALTFSGQAGLSIDETGALVIATPRGDIVQRAPAIYQLDDAGSRHAIDGGYVLRKHGRVGFHVGRYDRRHPLVIDPVLGYSTYLGGPGGEQPGAVAVDNSGNVYITGWTNSLEFPQHASPAPPRGLYIDAFILKLNAAGDSVVYASFLGGNHQDYGSDVYVDADGNAYVAGTTFSIDFPTVNAAQPVLAGDSDIFLTRFGPSGLIEYSTFLGGKGQDTGSGVGVDLEGRPYVSGWTFSTDFPTRNPIQSRLSGTTLFKSTTNGAAWVPSDSGLNATSVLSIVIDPENPSTVYAGTEADGVFKSIDGAASWSGVNAGLSDTRVYALAFGGGSPAPLYAGTSTGLYRTEDGGASWQPIPNLNGFVMSIVVDPSSPSTIYAVLPPTALGVFKTTDGGESWTNIGPDDQVNAFAVSSSSPSTVYAGTSRGVMRSDAGGDGWVLTGEEYVLGSVHAIAVDPADSSVVYAATDHGLFRSVSGGTEWSLVGPFGFLLALAPSSPSTLYVYTGSGVAVSHDRGDTWGEASISDSPVWALAVDPVDSSIVYAGSTTQIDGVLARLSADGASLEQSTYLGGSSFDEIADVAFDASGGIYLAGPTSSPDFSTVNAVQPTFGGRRDCFVVKLSPAWSIVYATYLGGANLEYECAMAVDAAGSAHVAGETYSTDFPVGNAQQPAYGGGGDAFVVKLTPAGDSFVYSTFLGGSGGDSARGISLSSLGDVVVVGTTSSANFPTLDPVQPALHGGVIDIFATRLSVDGVRTFSTFLGGGAWDYGYGAAVTADDRIWVLGETVSADFPTRNPLQTLSAGIVLVRIDPEPPDTTPPVSSLQVSGDQGGGGWYVSPVTVQVSASDDASGVAGIEYSLNDAAWAAYSTPIALSTSGTTVVRARATDQAGNVEPAPASATLGIDLDAPTVAIASPRTGTYLHSDVLALSFSASDSTSGLAGDPAGNLDGSAVSNGTSVSLLALGLGTHHVTVSARDVAGNAAETSVAFEVVATVDSLIATVNALTSSGAVDGNTAGSLVAKLEDAQQALARGNVTAARSKLEDFINAVAVRTGRGVTAGAASLLTSDAQYVLGTM